MPISQVFSFFRLHVLDASSSDSSLIKAIVDCLTKYLLRQLEILSEEKQAMDETCLLHDFITHCKGLQSLNPEIGSRVLQSIMQLSMWADKQTDFIDSMKFLGRRYKSMKNIYKELDSCKESVIRAS
jgi:hypothetical protein